MGPVMISQLVLWILFMTKLIGSHGSSEPHDSSESHQCYEMEYGDCVFYDPSICMVISTAKATYAQATECCESSSFTPDGGISSTTGHLAYLIEEELWSWLNSHITSEIKNWNKAYWIGLEYSETCQWCWHNGSKASYAAWKVGEPDYPELEQCVLIQIGTKTTEINRWESKDCSYKARYICQFDILDINSDNSTTSNSLNTRDNSMTKTSASTSRTNSPTSKTNAPASTTNSLTSTHAPTITTDAPTSTMNDLTSIANAAASASNAPTSIRTTNPPNSAARHSTSYSAEDEKVSFQLRPSASSQLKYIADVVEQTAGNMTPEDIMKTVHFLGVQVEWIVDSNMDGSHLNYSMQLIADLVNNLLSDANRKGMDTLQNIWNTGSELMFHVEKLAAHIFTTMLHEEEYEITRDCIVFYARRSRLKDFGTMNTYNDAMGVTKLHANVDVLHQDHSLDSNVTVVHIMYKDMWRMLPSNYTGVKSVDRVGSNVISVQVLLERDPVSVPILYSLQTINQNDSDAAGICVFWMFNSSLPTGGMWSSEGCESIEIGSETTHCYCNHTTNFAVLLQVVDIQIVTGHSQALDIITYAGCSIATVCLLASFAVLLTTRSLDSDRMTIHKVLIAVISSANITFLAGQQAVGNQLACRLVSVLLHLLWLSAFAWMLVEGLHLYLYVIVVYQSKLRNLKVYTLIGFGIPVLIVGVSTASGFYGYGLNNDHCWLSIDTGLIWAFAGPAILILLMNSVLLAFVVRAIMKATIVHKRSDYQHVKAGLKGTLTLTPILGLTWAFGLLAVKEELVAFSYIFAILNSMQGVFVFLFFIVGNSEVRTAVAREAKKRANAVRLHASQFNSSSVPHINSGQLSSQDGQSRRSSAKSSLEVKQFMPILEEAENAPKRQEREHSNSKFSKNDVCIIESTMHGSDNASFEHDNENPSETKMIEKAVSLYTAQLSCSNISLRDNTGVLEDLDAGDYSDLDNSDILSLRSPSSLSKYSFNGDNHLVETKNNVSHYGRTRSKYNTRSSNKERSASNSESCTSDNVSRLNSGSSRSSIESSRSNRVSSRPNSGSSLSDNGSSRSSNRSSRSKRESLRSNSVSSNSVTSGYSSSRSRIGSIARTSSSTSANSFKLCERQFVRRASTQSEVLFTGNEVLKVQKENSWVEGGKQTKRRQQSRTPRIIVQNFEDVVLQDI
ncbi:unnamed protein product [Owenia fusiformis]|uniref:Uncharacterized protein n=1 Tax=Owenia fusiformis TaxID=6347 RepID=A0A8S4PVF5_OWEFU|nr:unnamed protein product [Owenia fusiformis]